MNIFYRGKLRDEAAILEGAKPFIAKGFCTKSLARTGSGESCYPTHKTADGKPLAKSFSLVGAIVMVSDDSQARYDILWSIREYLGQGFDLWAEGKSANDVINMLDSYLSRNKNGQDRYPQV